MRTAEERIRRLHSRAAELERSRDRRQIACLGSASVFFAILLSVMIAQTNDLEYSVMGDAFTGSSLLNESTGGYVLVAVIAFFAGVAVTAIIFRCRRR